MHVIIRKILLTIVTGGQTLHPATPATYRVEAVYDGPGSVASVSGYGGTLLVIRATRKRSIKRNAPRASASRHRIQLHYDNDICSSSYNITHGNERKRF